MRTAARALASLVIVLAATTAVLGTAPAGAADAGTESSFVAALNDVRARQGLAPLEVHGELVGVARAWADTMANAGEIWHNPDLAGQVTAPWTVVGENVGVGGNVGQLVDAFVASRAHYANIVDPRYDWIGVGVTWGADGRMYTAHVFMDMDASAPPPPPPARTAPAPAPASAPVATPAAPVAPPAPVTPPPPPAAAAPERVQAVLAAVHAVGADGVA